MGRAHILTIHIWPIAIYGTGDIPTHHPLTPTPYNIARVRRVLENQGCYKGVRMKV
jgi:hypothetical protein